jgi:fibronectin-binding autotransporter adhesin
MGGAAQAATFTVGSTADSTGATDCNVPTNADCTLREALTQAETSANSGSTVTFASGLTGTITLGSTLPTIAYPTTIQGPGPGQIAVSGDGAFQVFYVDTADGADVGISGLTITHGDSGSYGGGIESYDADLSVSNAVVSRNNSAMGGGGIFAGASAGSLTISTSTVSGNTTDVNGGGVYTPTGSGTPATINSSTISGNQATGYGGGVYFDYSAHATVQNSTVYGNSADRAGGGLYHYGRPNGPGLAVLSTTITHNSSADRGGGIASAGNPVYGQPVIRSTIISGNSAPVGADLSGSGPSYDGSIDAALSLIGSIDPTTSVGTQLTGSDIIGQDPQLGPLQDNGGSTETQKPAVTSPVIDKGAAFGLTSDQRGQPRPFEVPVIQKPTAGDGADIGAVELQASDMQPNGFTAKLKGGKKVVLSVPEAGMASVFDARSPVQGFAKKKKASKRQLDASFASGGPPTITVPLRLTTVAKKLLRAKGKLTVKARVTFTPNRGLANHQTMTLRIRGKRKR